MGRKAKAVDVANQPLAREVAGKRRFAVRLKDNPQLTVEAADAAGAWGVYRQAVGIVASDHVPEVSEVFDSDAPGKPDDGQGEHSGEAGGDHGQSEADVQH